MWRGTPGLPGSEYTAEAIASTAREAIRQVREGRRELPAEPDSDSDFAPGQDHAEAAAGPAGFNSVLQTTRTRFRRRRVQDQNEQRRRDNRGRRGRAKNQIWKARLFLLRRSNPDFYPVKGECTYLNSIGLGNPPNLDPASEGKVHLQRNWSLQQFEDYVISAYPDQPLARTGFRIASCSKSKKLTILANLNTVWDIDKKVGRGQIVIVPNRDLHVVLPPNQEPVQPPPHRERPAHQPPPREQPAHHSPTRPREQPAHQPPPREQPAHHSPPRPREQPAHHSPPREQPAHHSPPRERPAHHSPHREQPAHQPLQQPMHQDPDTFPILSDFEISSDESPDEHTPNAEPNGETGTPTIIFQPNRQAFSNLEALLQAGEITAVFHRSRLMEEMLEFYKNTSTVNRRLKVIFDGEDGEDVGGLTREAFTSFWNAAHREYFAGENVCLPFLPNHRMHKERENIVSLGRILSHTALLTKTFPSYIAKSVYVALIFDSEVNEECLLDDLQEYCTRPERRLISKALLDFDSLTPTDTENLTQFFMACDFHAIPTKAEVRAQLLAIGNLLFVQKPAPIYRLIRQGIPEGHLLTFWSQLSIGDITTLLNAQKPTPSRVSAAITTSEDDLTNNQDRVVYFPRLYVRSLRAEELQDFLQFCTGSIHMPHDGIKVSFNKTSGALRRPIAHTCSNVLELSELYTTYQEFRRELHLYLSNSMSFTFSTL